MNQDEKGKHKMITREEDFLTKQQQGSSSITDHHHGKITTKASSSSSSTPWLKLKDPRIVRVSRALGGKDRHSKVCTIRGLRDRRVRLSVPTAIQLYDLQDRLGLNQPSKVVDWLLDAAKHEIDELPPLQIPLGNFGPSHHSMLVSHEGIASQFTREGLKIANGIDWGDPTGLPRSNLWNSRSKSKEVAGETVNEKEINWTKRIDQEGKQQGIDQELGHGSQVSSSNLFSRTNHSSSFQGLLHSIMPHGSSCYHLEPPSNSNISLSQLGSHGIASGQTEDHLGHSFSVVPLQSTLSLPSGSHVLVCPSGSTTTQSYFPSHSNAASMELDPRQINHIQMLRSINPHNLMSSTSFAPPSYSISPSLRPLQLSMTPSHFHSQNDTKGQQPRRDT